MKKFSLISMMLACFILCSCIQKELKPDQNQLPSPANDSVQTNKNESKVVKLFDDRTIIPQEVIDPSGLPECLLVIEKKGDKDFYYWTKVVASRPDPKPEFNNEIIYESIVDKSFTTKANYLTVAASLGAEDKVELIIEDVFKSKGAAFTDPAIKLAAENFVNADPKKASRTYFYIQNVKYTTVKYKIFRKVEGAGGFTGVGFGADGKVYASNSDYSLQKIVSINTFPLEPVVDQKKKLPSIIKSLELLK